MKAGIVAGWDRSPRSTWPSGHYIPQSRNGCPPLPTNSWLKTHNGHPGQPLRGAPSGTSVWEAVRLDNGLHLKLHSGRGRSRLGGAVNCSGGVARGHGEGSRISDHRPVVKTRSPLPSHAITHLLPPRRQV